MIEWTNPGFGPAAGGNHRRERQECGGAFGAGAERAWLMIDQRHLAQQFAGMEQADRLAASGSPHRHINRDLAFLDDDQLVARVALVKEHLTSRELARLQRTGQFCQGAFGKLAEQADFFRDSGLFIVLSKELKYEIRRRRLASRRPASGVCLPVCSLRGA